MLQNSRFLHSPTSHVPEFTVQSPQRIFKLHWILFQFALFSLLVWQLDKISLSLWTYRLSFSHDKHKKQFYFQWVSVCAQTQKKHSRCRQLQSEDHLQNKAKKKKYLWILCWWKSTPEKEKKRKKKSAVVRFLMCSRKNVFYYIFVKWDLFQRNGIIVINVAF